MDWQSFFFFPASLSVTLQTSTLLSNSNVAAINHILYAHFYIAKIDSLMLSRTTYIQYSYTKQCNNARIIRYVIFGNTELLNAGIFEYVFLLQYLTIHTANIVASGVNIGEYEQRLKIRRYLQWHSKRVWCVLTQDGNGLPGHALLETASYHKTYAMYTVTLGTWLAFHIPVI